MNPKLDEARLRELEQWDADYKSLCLLSGRLQRSARYEDAKALERTMSRASLSYTLSDALSAERERADREVAVLKWHTDETVREIVDNEPLATQKAER